MSGAVSIYDDESRAAKRKVTEFKVTIASTATIGALASQDVWFRKATIWGLKNWQTDNAGDVFVGGSSSAGENHRKIYKGGYIVIEAPLGSRFNLADFYLEVATNGDGVVVEVDQDYRSAVTLSNIAY